MKKCSVIDISVECSWIISIRQFKKLYMAVCIKAENNIILLEMLEMHTTLNIARYRCGILQFEIHMPSYVRYLACGFQIEIIKNLEWLVPTLNKRPVMAIV